MPTLAAINTIEFPNKTEQQLVKEYAQDFFAPSFPQVARMISAFDNTEIVTRNFCKPLSHYASLTSFKQRNEEYINTSLDYSVAAIERCMADAGVLPHQLTDIIFVSTTGLATPSMDALIINEMRLNQHITRTPIFGLGCAGGVGGYAKACTLAIANPDAVVLLVAVELCSLTFLSTDFSKSNFIASSLFSDGIAACIVRGDNHEAEPGRGIRFVAAQSKMYYDSLDVMGWNFQDDGFKVLFSADIPTIIKTHIYTDVTHFLAKHGLTLDDIKNFIFHPGGKKVLAAYEEALPVDGDFLKNTREVMQENGNLSSATVLYVMEKFHKTGYVNGYGLMVTLGPGFSCEMVLLQMHKS